MVLQGVLVGLADEFLEAVVGAEGAVFAFPGQACGDLGWAKLHATDRVRLAVRRRLAGLARLVDYDFAGKSLQLSLTKTEELGVRERVCTLPDLAGNEYLVALGIGRQARGEVDVGADVVTFAVEDAAPVEAGTDGRELRLPGDPILDLERA